MSNLAQFLVDINSMVNEFNQSQARVQGLEKELAEANTGAAKMREALEVLQGSVEDMAEYCDSHSIDTFNGLWHGDIEVMRVRIAKDALATNAGAEKEDSK